MGSNVVWMLILVIFGPLLVAVVGFFVHGWIYAIAYSIAKERHEHRKFMSRGSKNET